ncbi:delta-1-pyrroline-5-carboxylate dehydrogenase, partial [Vibrio parahaemolyticus]
GLGVFVCISPWNFPLAIFLGQVTAALVAGNTVVAKPAEQTSLIAARAIDLMLEAGFPAGVIQLLPGRGGEIGHALTSHDAIAGVAFTGSTATAQRINVTLAERTAKPVPFIAETGGQNAMIVDSTALPEQVVRDVIRSAFASAGQRCSALRVLFVQEDVADRIITLIQGAMKELHVGLPYLHKTDVGPVIDRNAKQKLLAHLEQMSSTQKKVAQLQLEEACQYGDFVAPSAFEISGIDVLKEEQFGPILHIVRFKASELPNVVEQINQTGFGLTMGIHSRNETTYRWIEKHARVGNCYINRDQVGAVVGVQPFGGQGLSGTGPKAGGPHYLYRFTQHLLAQAENA